MTILCPKEFHEAVKFAESAEYALARYIEKEDDAQAHKILESRRGQAVTTLLQCIGYRANSDAIENADPWISDEMEVVVNGIPHRMTCKSEIPLRETFIMTDGVAPHSFFFREGYIHPQTRMPVEVFDKVWYMFSDGTTLEQAKEMTPEELEKCLPKQGCGMTWRREEADAQRDKGLVVFETKKRRIGMCGGIIYHPDYDKDGHKLPYGSWSTHT